MTTTTLDRPVQTPFDQIGGVVTVRRVVDRFYDLMDADPAYEALRAMHARDLTPMRDSLTGFLTAWLGGPRDWFVTRPGACVMSAHARLTITPNVAAQWTSAMAKALDDGFIDVSLRDQISVAFTRMSQGMVRR